jgi:hypothetical protein
METPAPRSRAAFQPSSTEGTGVALSPLCRLDVSFVATTWLVAALVTGLVFALYGDVLGYAFMYDDGIDLARGEDRSVWSLLTSAEGAFYYRPVPFLLWKAMHAVLGSYDPFWFHLPSLLLHALNAWLLYLLARALGLGPLAGVLAAILFVVCPFHYQAVPWAGALFHPLVTACVLGAVLAYRRARLERSPAWMGASLLCATLGLFTHEYAITLGFLIAGLELYLARRGEINRFRPYALLYLGLAGLFALWWLAVPKWPREFAVHGESLVQNGLMFAQAALWPLTITWRWAPPELHAQSQAMAVLGAIVLLGLASWLGWRARRAPVAALAIGWLVVTAFPVWATLPLEYLEDGSRLYYLPGIGIALAWAAVSQHFARAGWPRCAALTALAALCVWGVWQSLEFLAVRRSMYADGTALLRQAAALTHGVPREGEVVFLNLPAWQAPVVPAFPLGNTGVTFVPEYVLLGQALYVNGAGPAAVESFASADLPDGWPSHYGPHGPWLTGPDLDGATQDASAAYVVRYGTNPLRLERIRAPASSVAERPPRAGAAAGD